MGAISFALTGTPSSVGKPRRTSVERVAGQPTSPPSVQTFDCGALTPWHVGLHRVADGGLQVSQVPVAIGKLVQESWLEHEHRARIYGINSVLFIYCLTE